MKPGSTVQGRRHCIARPGAVKAEKAGEQDGAVAISVSQLARRSSENNEKDGDNN